MSKQHQGKSQQYNYKMQVREQRKVERAILRIAKEKFFAANGRDKPLSRVALRRFKKEVRKNYQNKDIEPYMSS